MNNQKNKNDEENLILEEFIKLRPTRAVDRLLNENSVDQVYNIYQHLQYLLTYLGKKSEKIQLISEALSHPNMKI